MTHDEALKLIHDVNYFGTCMVASGDADGMVSGAIHTTADTVRPALQLIKVIIELGLMHEPAPIKGNFEVPLHVSFFSPISLCQPAQEQMGLQHV